MVIEICVKHPGGPTRIRGTDIIQHTSLSPPGTATARSQDIMAFVFYKAVAGMAGLALALHTCISKKK
jgi:hypothetical protein